MRRGRVGGISVVASFNTTGDRNCWGKRWCWMRNSGGSSTKGRRSTSRSHACSVLCVVIGLGGHGAGDVWQWTFESGSGDAAATMGT